MLVVAAVVMTSYVAREGRSGWAGIRRVRDGWAVVVVAITRL